MEIPFLSLEKSAPPPIIGFRGEWLVGEMREFSFIKKSHFLQYRKFTRFYVGTLDFRIE